MNANRVEAKTGIRRGRDRESRAAGDGSGGNAPAASARPGAPERIRTPNPQIRSLVLYPIELRAQPGAAV